ncbi:hypothetical protein V6N12_029389 [Hibiscus sabdariffa]|uniref:Uncharacterized protein n=1 Tax=Hibiscus sabdariffa TaxID=183260 RepID=A0ABR2CVZ5_9ROSI
MMDRALAGEKFMGSSWGEDGYIRVKQRDIDAEDGHCGIAMEASSPIKSSTFLLIKICLILHYSALQLGN